MAAVISTKQTKLPAPRLSFASCIWRLPQPFTVLDTAGARIPGGCSSGWDTECRFPPSLRRLGDYTSQHPSRCPKKVLGDSVICVSDVIWKYDKYAEREFAESPPENGGEEETQNLFFPL
ncbi:hypothetical protein chiPu_0006533 [Chiloscyllium punctatum]|uniref:Uncharacterized protein n=1 Tax=Chiloscyllium punctatum TaxID=137246 RepID=A0A401SCG3_CHIPU|nr:hypothetical protein [Chiloscyllium punctatum]